MKQGRESLAPLVDVSSRHPLLLYHARRTLVDQGVLDRAYSMIGWRTPANAPKRGQMWSLRRFESRRRPGELRLEDPGEREKSQG